MNTPDTNLIRVNTSPMPFNDLQKFHYVHEGLNLSETIDRCDIGAPEYSTLIVFVNDKYIDKDEWHLYFPLSDDIISINVSVSGSGDSGSGKNPYRTIAMIAVMALAMAAPYTAPAIAAGMGAGTVGGAFLTAGIAIAGSLAVNALIPPYADDNDDLSKSPSMGGGGLRNQANYNGIVPVCFGTNKVYPPYAAQPYTELIGDDVYGRYLFAVGKGEYSCRISDMKIGETPLTNFDDSSAPPHSFMIATGDIDEINDTYPIYPNDVNTATYSIKLTNAAGWQTRTTVADTEEIIVDVTHPAGLWWTDDDGDNRSFPISFEAQYSVKDSGEWYQFDNSPINLRKMTWDVFTSTFVQTNLTAAEYDVRVRKISHDTDFNALSTASAGNEDIYWTALKSVKYAPPVNLDNVYLIALRIKLTDQLIGVNTFNIIASKKVAKWDGSAWTATQKTNNPAWAYAEVLRGDSNKNPAPDSRIDGDALLEWANFCDDKGFEYNRIIDYKTTVWDLCNSIASIGRASRAIIDNKYSVILDLTHQVPVQHFSPRNSFGFNATKIFLDVPHAIKCKFLNKDIDYVEDERIVYRDGYDEDSATDFETMSFYGATDKDHVWKLARYHLAVALQRPETYEINVDFENLVCKRGDMVRLTHDVIAVGLGQARIKSVTSDGDGYCTGLTMDDQITMVGGTSYGANIRLANGTMVSATITTNAGEQTAITFVFSIPPANHPAIGNLIFFGEVGSVAIECVVLGIEPGPDLTARLRLADYATDIIDYDGGDVPAYTPTITIQPDMVRVPPVVTILSVTLSKDPISLTSAGVGWLDKVSTFVRRINANLRANVNFSVDIGTEIDPQYYQGHYRSYDTDSDGTAGYTNWTEVPVVSSDVRSIQFPVENGRTYDFRVRSISENSQTSAWDTYSDYEVSFVIPNPSNITGLQLLQGGSTFSGGDIEITWTTSNDSYRVEKYKIDIFKTTGNVFLRTEYKNWADPFFSYTLQMNTEDNSGTPVGGISFKVWAVNLNEDTSAQSADIAVTNATPSNITGLAGASQSSGVDFTWTSSTDNGHDHYLYRVSVGAALNGESWLKTEDPNVRQVLTEAQKTTYGSNATIYFEVKAVDLFGSESGTVSTNANCGILNILTADFINLALSLNINDATFGNDGIQLDYNSGNPRAYIGNGTNRFFSFDGTNVSWEGANTSLTTGGLFTATNAVITGQLTATTGAIGGWVVNEADIKDAAGVVGMSSAVTGGDDIRFFAGHATPSSAPFRVTEAGALTASSATITGVINAATGYIGGASGWIIAAGKMTSSGIGLATAAGDATYAIWAGDNTPGSAEFRVTHAGALVASSATITGSITSTSGTIGGWIIGEETLTAGGLVLDEGNTRIRATTGSNYSEMSPSGFTCYDSVLGTTVNIPTDGSAPQFSSGILEEFEYRIYTVNDVFRTNADPASNGGLIINNTQLTAYSSTPTKLLEFIYDGANEGDAYIGDYDNTNPGIKYDHSAGTLNVRGAIIITNPGDIDTSTLNNDANWDQTSAQFTNALATIDTQTDRAELGFDASGNVITKVIPASNAAPSGAGLYLGADYMGYYNGSAWRVYMDASSNLYAGDGSDEYFQYSIAGGVQISTAKADAVTIKNGGAISLEAGGDLNLIGDDSNPSLLKWDTTTDLYFGAMSTGSKLCLWPATEDNGQFAIGYDAENSTTKRMYAVTFDLGGSPSPGFVSNSRYDADNWTQLWSVASNETSSISMAAANSTYDMSLSLNTQTGAAILHDGKFVIDMAAGNDPILVFQRSGINVFTIGVDDSDSDKFKINSGGSLADPSDFEIDSSGNVEIAGNITAVGTVAGLIIGTDVLAEQTIGIADNNLVEIDDADAADNDYAKFTANGLEGRSYAEVKTDLSLNNVDNTSDATKNAASVTLTNKTIEDPTISGSGITMGEDDWIGIGSGSERIIFDGTANEIAIEGATLALGQLGGDEGAELHMEGGDNGAGTDYDDWIFDAYQNSLRIRTNTANLNLLNLLNLGAGRMDLGLDGVIRFGSHSSAPGSPSAGWMCWATWGSTDPDQLVVYNGSNWVSLHDLTIYT